MPLARALSPMKRQRCSTFTPGQSVSTMKQLIFFVFGSRAMTTSSSASVPFVHQSFSPFEHEGVAVALGGRREARRVGADVRLGEREGRDRTGRAARQVLLLLLGGAEELQRLRHADRLVRREQRADVAVVRSRPSA